MIILVVARTNVSDKCITSVFKVKYRTSCHVLITADFLLGLFSALKVKTSTISETSMEFTALHGATNQIILSFANDL
jgi:hypothetical protein